MDAGRFWLVDIVATTRTRIRLVTDGPSAIRARYNTHPHNMSFDQVVVQLHECFEDGLILADQMDLTVANLPQGVIVREGLRLDLDDMMRLRNDPSLDFEYFLTKEGGAQWESFAIPEWPCFYEDDYDDCTLGKRLSLASN